MSFDLVRKGAIKAATLTTVAQILRIGKARAAAGKWLIISWVDKDAANIVKVEFGATEGALGANAKPVHPTTGSAWVYIEGQVDIGVAGVAGFDVTLEVI